MKLQNEYNDGEKLFQVLGGTSYGVYLSKADRQSLENYKNGLPKKIEDDKKKEMEVLLLLEKLGYPMDELGTYLYKNLIVYVINRLENVESKEQILNTKQLLTELKDFFSRIYLELARFDLEMGIKTFHYYIMEALNKRDFKKADKNLIYDIYSRFSYEIDYAEQAYILGAYMLGKFEPVNVDSEEVKLPKIKKLNNMPRID